MPSISQKPTKELRRMAVSGPGGTTPAGGNIVLRGEIPRNAERTKRGFDMGEDDAVGGRDVHGCHFGSGLLSWVDERATGRQCLCR